MKYHHHMKYHDHTIICTIEELGWEDEEMNKVYSIWDNNGKFITTTCTLGNAKEYIDSGYDATYLC